MEQHDTFFPRDPKRRWVLAKLLNIPPVLLALVGLDVIEESLAEQKISTHRQKPLDLEEYHTVLQAYWLQGYPSLASGTVREIATRLRLLHAQVLYSHPTEKREILRLLCGYHLLLAKIAEDQCSYESALQSFQKALLLAQENNSHDLYAAVLFRRACMLLRYESFFAAEHGYSRVIEDLSHLKQLEQTLSPQINGKILAVTAKVQIHQAVTNVDFSATLRLLDRAEATIGKSAPDQFAYLAALDEERYCLDRAEVLMLSPIKELRAPQRAQEYLYQAASRSNSDFRQLHIDRQIDIDLFQARIYLDQKYYPIAAATVENAVLAMQQLRSRKRLKDAAYLLQQLKESHPYMPEVISLDLEVLKLAQPHSFQR